MIRIRADEMRGTRPLPEIDAHVDDVAIPVRGAHREAPVTSDAPYHATLAVDPGAFARGRFDEVEIPERHTRSLGGDLAVHRGIAREVIEILDRIERHHGHDVGSDRGDRTNRT